MATDGLNNLTRIREIISTDDPDLRLPKIDSTVSVLIERVEKLEQRVQTLELERERLHGDLREIAQLAETDTSLLSALSKKLKWS